ncbi:MAG: DUF2730 domain-containing protein [Bifidobacteriaceae bacterium]|jgi:hypothetical protein|nr:DUF2730 domain-containing protein [Bifidobacteriaceae bacterium]
MRGNQRSTAILALVALLALALAVGTYFLLYAPALEARSEAITKAEDAESENEQAQAELNKLAEDAKHLDEKKAELEAKRSQFPTDLELAEFTDDLWNLAQESGATVKSVASDMPVAVTVAAPLPKGPDSQEAPVVPQPPANLYQYKFTIEIEGVLEQTQKFLAMLQADEGRLFSVTDVQMTGDSETADANGLTNVAEYTIIGYTYALVPADKIPDSSTEGGSNG